MKSAIVVAEVFEDYRRLVYLEAQKFTDRWGGDFEDNFQEACIAFMRAYNALDTERGKFSTLLTWAIRHRLSNLRVRSQCKCRDERCCPVRLDREIGSDGESLAGHVPDRIPVYNFDRLTEDAKFIIDLVLIAPKELKQAVNARGGHSLNWRKVLRKHLKDIGWTGRRIAEGFYEIGSVFT